MTKENKNWIQNAYKTELQYNKLQDIQTLVYNLGMVGSVTNLQCAIHLLK